MLANITRIQTETHENSVSSVVVSTLNSNPVDQGSNFFTSTSFYIHLSVLISLRYIFEMSYLSQSRQIIVAPSVDLMPKTL